MSPLSEELRDELAGIAPRRDCDRLAELSGLFHAAGSAHLRGRGEISLHLDLASSAAARRAFRLLRELGVETEIRTYRRHAFDQATRYQLHVEGKQRALQVLHEAGVLDQRLAPVERPPRRVVARPCCRAAYLRGALLGGGSLSGPRAPHLELRTASVEGAEFLAAVAAGEGVTLRVRDRGSHAIAYAKGRGADRGRARRRRRLQRGAGLRGAGRDGGHARPREPPRERRPCEPRAHEPRRARPAPVRCARSTRPESSTTCRTRLREVGRLRLRYPTLSLRELAERCDPPATKAAVYRRLSKLRQLAEEKG